MQDDPRPARPIPQRQLDGLYRTHEPVRAGVPLEADVKDRAGSRRNRDILRRVADDPRPRFIRHGRLLRRIFDGTGVRTRRREIGWDGLRRSDVRQVIGRAGRRVVASR